ncbi:MAG: hypothetical protein IJ966_03150 [Bacilli bacterium]|nr:hypothetical protein [Bacilli bacterium]
MIKTLDIEFKILVYIIAFGIYYFAVSDVLLYIVEKKKNKKIYKILLEVVYLISQVYITYNFCYRLENGYIPIYFLLFIIIGFLLYYLFMRTYFIKCLDFISNLLIKVKPLLLHLLYSATIFKKKIKIRKRKQKQKRNKNVNSVSQNT